MIFKAVAPNGQIVEDKKHGQERDYNFMVIIFFVENQKWSSNLITVEESKAKSKAKKLAKFMGNENVSIVKVIK